TVFLSEFSSLGHNKAKFFKLSLTFLDVVREERCIVAKFADDIPNLMLRWSR
ncbi:unnamed protein product, partial [Ceratitis capitata]